ncbi:GatB/YqeY domain-containing protein [Byssothecium circinans]|uniref:Altered inheritance of mitochondria protein 41 n=1 Tax=Byssothecium circinans TaxID=147558 RepID=A0A6A5U6Z4_9PLEO|nr:GatB/YqeY domain-containing protein [Byssothecium circinans]
MSLLRLLPRASLFSPRQPTLLRTFLATRPLSQEAPSTVLSTIKPDLKTALRSKDKPRLSVLRSLLAEITNASKTTSPIASDQTFYNLLQKQIKSSNTAIEEFNNARREDLVEKEKVQLGVLKEYRDRIDVVGEEEMEGLVRSVVEMEKESGKWEALKEGARKGVIMGKTRARIGDRPVDGEVLSGVITRVVGEGV